MKKVILTIAISSVFATSVWAYCVQTKQCCRQTISGLECIQKCAIEMCPIGYDIEIK